MILTDLLRAAGQFGDPRFQSVLWRGLGVSALLLALATGAAVWGVNHLIPAHLTLPWIGAVGGLHLLAGGAALLAMLLLSSVLMGPVAAAFTGIFLDEVAAAVEARHYPGLPPARVQGWGEMVGDGLRLALLCLGVNLIALVACLPAGPAAPLLFWAVNGYLLGREYAQGAAGRRLAPAEARALCRRHPGPIWALGTLLAVPLTSPLLILCAPILAAAAFTHLTRRLSRQAPSARPAVSGRG